MAASINADNGAVSGSAGLKSSADSTGVLALQTNGTTALTVGATQLVSIGTASPSASYGLLTVAGPGISITPDTSSKFQIGRYSAGAPYSYIKMGSTSSGFKFTDPTDSFDLMTLSSTGALALYGASTSANGVGITFPATQSASSNANTLDDYEEGTWTPVDGSGASLSFTVTEARYTKIGRMVQCFAQIAYPSTANTSQAAISGLPFTMAATVGGAYGAFTVYTTEPTASTWLNLSGTATSVAYALGGANATNATFSTDNFRLVWIYESA
jgi:hypothetical protein